MTDQTAQEPTMEEILASIRRIISEDDAPAETAAPAEAAEATAEPEPAPVADEPPAAEDSAALMDETPANQEPESSEDDVLELTDRYEAPTETIGDLDVHTEAEAEPAEPAPAPSAPAAPAPAYDALVGDSAAASAASAFAGLAASMRQPDANEKVGTGPTLDELVRALLRPMLKDWLDANLPGIVETQVRKEVERIARSAG